MDAPTDTPQHVVVDCVTGAITVHEDEAAAAAADAQLQATAAGRQQQFGDTLRSLLEASQAQALAQFNLSNPAISEDERAAHQQALADAQQQIQDGIAVIADLHPAMAADLAAIASPPTSPAPAAPNQGGTT